MNRIIRRVSCASRSYTGRLKGCLQDDTLRERVWGEVYVENANENLGRNADSWSYSERHDNIFRQEFQRALKLIYEI